MTAYTKGAVTLTNGSTVVTGRLTTFSNMSAPGDLLCHGGVSAVVRQPISNTEIELLHPWRGPNVVETDEYAILHVSSFWSSNITTNEKLLEIIGLINAGLGWKADATGTLAERADFDDAPKGFVFLCPSPSPATIYIKQSSAGGDWSDGTPMTGQGTPGERGPKGDPFKVDATGPLSGRNQFNGQPKGFAYLATDTGSLYIRETDTDGVWSDPVPFGKGDDGRAAEFRKSADHLQWRLVGDAEWIDLVPLADFRGADGREVKLRATATHLQWQYGGDTVWMDIFAFADIDAAGQAAVASVNAARDAAITGVGDARGAAVSDVEAVAAPVAGAAQDAANAAATAALSAGDAGVSAAAAAAAQSAAESARDDAVAAQIGVSDARDQAVAAAATAQYARDWATAGEDVVVNDGVNPAGHSARHWAIKAAQSAEFDPDLYLTKAGNLGGVNDPAAARANLLLGSAATAAASAFATASQGAKADTAVQPAVLDDYETTADVTTKLAEKAPLNSPQFTGNPTAPTPTTGNASTSVATTKFVADTLEAFVGAAPEALDTLIEIADALGNDPNFAATITSALAGKLSRAANLSDLTDVEAARAALELGSAARQVATAFATAAQGEKADSALQPTALSDYTPTSGLADVAISGDYTDLENSPSIPSTPADVGAEPAGQLLGINTQTGTSYTLVLADAGKAVERSNSSANTVTVPPNSSVAFPIGARIDVFQMGAGQTTIVAGSGVTIRSADNKLALAKQYAGASLYKRAADEWVLIGGLA